MIAIIIPTIIIMDIMRILSRRIFCYYLHECGEATTTTHPIHEYARM
jgi:hypothetical protein